MAQTAKGKLVQEYCQKWRDLPSLTLAKMIYKEHGSVFTNIEAARSAIRWHRGASGDKLRKAKADRSLFGTGRIVDLPLEESEDYKPMHLAKKDNNIGVISDIHIPNHRNLPINIALNFLQNQKINTLLINGDLLDNTPFTKFLTPPDKKDARKYLDKAERFLEVLRTEFPEARIIWLEGNHDFWYKQYLMRKAPELYGDPYYQLQERLNLDEYKIEFLQQERYLMAGKLAICHGHHLIKGIFSPVNAARGVYLRAKVSALIGHVHVDSSHTETNMHGEMVTTWSTGCLCTLTPDYQPMGGKATHGFAHVTTQDNGHFTVKNYRIHKGEIL